MKCKEWISPFDRWGLWIVRRFPRLLCGKKGKSMEKKLKNLETTRYVVSVEEYYSRKFAKMLRIFVVGSFILIVVGLTAPGGVIHLKEAVIERPDVGEGNRKAELKATIQDGEPLTVTVVIGERSYSDEETREVFAAILQEMEPRILGENVSLREVRTNLNLPESFQNGTVKAIWEVEPYEYMDHTGRIRKEIPKEGIEGRLRLTLQYREESFVQEYTVMFLPEIKTPAEEQADSLKEMIEQAAEEYPEGSYVALPERLDGQKVSWGKEQQNLLIPGIFLLLVGMLFFYEREDRQIEEEEQRRRRQLIMDYPVLLYRMSMLLGAGMTIQGAFSKIAFFYRDRSRKEIRYVYEEMLLACYELNKGAGEAVTYEKFGQRCQEVQYLKFGSLLSQNLKKGSEDLAGILEKEARAGMEERKNLARKLGEEAGMKLLFPMLVMLILVMVILMVPAMISF